MAGLTLFLVVLPGWLLVAFVLGRWLGSLAKSRQTRVLITLLAVLILVPLPLVDEIASYPSFTALCKEKAVLRINAEKIRGRVVRFTYEQSYVPVGLLHALQTNERYLDTASGEHLASFVWLRARGGWLSRTLTEGGNPITFGDSYECEPKLEKRLEEVYEFTLIKN
jgi:hypothetical protein